MKNISLIFREVDKQGFEDIRSGLKEIETRAATLQYQNIQSGDVITFICADEIFTKTVDEVYRWSDIDAMVKAIPLHKVMPRISSIEDMRSVYASYPGYEEKIKEHGLMGFTFK